jgi:hypothetical protein
LGVSYQSSVILRTHAWAEAKCSWASCQPGYDRLFRELAHFFITISLCGGVYRPAEQTCQDKKTPNICQNPGAAPTEYNKKIVVDQLSATVVQIEVQENP